MTINEAAARNTKGANEMTKHRPEPDEVDFWTVPRAGRPDDSDDRVSRWGCKHCQRSVGMVIQWSSPQRDGLGYPPVYFRHVR